MEDTRQDIGEIELTITAEISYYYNGGTLERLKEKDLLPRTPEELADFKRDTANDIVSEIVEYLEADHVNVTNVQYFEKGPKQEAEIEFDAADESAEA